MVELIKAKVEKIIQVSDRLKIFRLVWENIHNFDFKAGQFINLSSNNFLDENNKLVRRAYSIVNASHEKKYLELCIAKQTYFSKFMNETIQEGDFLNVEGPFGHFLLKDCTQNITFIAGGTGIAPMVSFIRTLKKEKCDKDIWLFYSVRKKEDLAYLNEFEKYSKKNFEKQSNNQNSLRELSITQTENKSYSKFSKENPKFHFIPSCTRDNENWTGKKGRITEFLSEFILKNKNRDCYICGPPAMDKAVKEKLEQLGIKKENIHSENWG